MGLCYFTKIIKMDPKNFLLAFKSAEYKNIITLIQYNNFINETLIQAKTNGLDINKEFIESVFPKSKEIKEIEELEEIIDPEFSDELEGIDLGTKIPLKWVNQETLTTKNKYLKILIDNGFKNENLPTNTIKNIINSTSRILDRCNNPQNWNKDNIQGVVIGKVQSGKTISMLTLMSMALEEKYNLIIVLAGGNDTLRNQTQNRINTSFDIGHNRDLESSTKLGEYGSIGGHRSWSENILKYDSKLGEGKPTIICIKKRKEILEKLNNDLIEYNNAYKRIPKQYKEIVALILDDEVDSYSQNIKHKKGGSEIYKGIVNLRKNIEKNTYVGYTATPQACFASDPNGIVGFPRDFVWLLETEKGSNNITESYLGLNEYFNKWNNLLVTNLNPFDWPTYIKDINNGKSIHVSSPRTGTLIPIKKDSPKMDELVQIEIDSYIIDKRIDYPSNFIDSCIYFILGASIRWYRFSKQNKINITQLNIHDIQNKFPYHTMMWHIDKTIDRQNDITIIIQKIFIMIKNDFDKKSYTNYEKVIDKINNVTKSLTNYEPVIIKELIIYIEKVFKILFVPEESSNFVKTINSTTQDLKLDWHEEHEFVEAKHVKKICVINGGDTLSRGVTIKNLAVSVYTRNSKITFGDTALQMNRWFGHKFKYVDLCQLYINRQTEITFEQIADADDKFRKIIKKNILEDIPPLSTAYKLFSNTLFRLTSPSKSKFIENKIYDFSGELHQLLEPVFSKNELTFQKCVEHNYIRYNEWRIKLKQKYKVVENHLNRCTLIKDVSVQDIRTLFNELDINDDACYMSPESLLSYLDLWENEYSNQNLQYDIPGFNIALMNNPENKSSKFRQYQRKIYSNKEKIDSTLLKSQVNEKIVFDRFVSGARKTDKEFLGEKFIDKDIEWHKNENNRVNYERNERENILIAFNEFDPNYIKRGISFEPNEEGYLNPEIPIVSYFISFNTGEPKYTIHNNKFKIKSNDE